MVNNRAVHTLLGYICLFTGGLPSHITIGRPTLLAEPPSMGRCGQQADDAHPTVI